MNSKFASALRRTELQREPRYHASPGLEGNVCAFELTQNSPITLEAISGRPMIVAQGDVFFGTPGYRDSTRWLVGCPPKGGLVPGVSYWVLADCGIVGELEGASPLEKPYLGQVKYLGTLRTSRGRDLNIKQFGIITDVGAIDYGAPVYVVVGTSAEVGKTTAGISIIRTLRQQGHSKVIVLKATGVASVRELAFYEDFGAAQTFDFVDFGMPSTCPANRPEMEAVFESMLSACLSMRADAVLMECGSDMLGANVPLALQCTLRRRPCAKVILAAGDPLGAFGGKQVLQGMGISVSLITGPCADTSTALKRTQSLCGVPVVARSGSLQSLF
jgi:hypothetical protein